MVEGIGMIRSALFGFTRKIYPIVRLCRIFSIVSPISQNGLSPVHTSCECVCNTNVDVTNSQRNSH